MSVKIIVNNPGIIGPGDTIIGKVICTFTNQESIRGIRCKFRGLEQTHWSERHGRSTTHYAGKNEFIIANSNFVGEVTMNPGVHAYSFAYALPQSNIPSSYTHQFGSIRYYIQAYVDRPFAFDYKDEVTLHVIAPVTLDYNVENSQMVPVTYQTEKTVGSCCWASDPVELDVTLERDTYVLGEVINFKIHINNRSNVDIQSIHIELAWNVQFTTHSPSTRHKIEKNPITIGDDVGVAAHGQQTYNLNLKIPQTTIMYDFPICLLFKQWCSLNVEAVFPPFHRNLTLQSNLKLGHMAFGINLTPAGSTSNIVPIGQAPPVGYPPSNRRPPGAPLGQPQMATAPSAPIGLDEGEDFAFIDIGRGNVEPLPPSYDDVMKGHGPP